MSIPYMQLWTDETQSEYKIDFGNKGVVSTNSSVKYTRIIDETPFKDGYDDDWSYTLSQWVVHYLLNKFSKNVTNEKDRFSIRHESDIEMDNMISILISRQKPKKPRNKMIPKPGLKCRFCNLKYSLEIERKEHEEFWHSGKLLKM